MRGTTPARAVYLRRMGLRRSTFLVLGIGALVLVAAPPAAAKEGVKATLQTKIPIDAPAGTRFKVGGHWPPSIRMDKSNRLTPGVSSCAS